MGALTANQGVAEAPQKATMASEVHFDVPFYYQEKDYYCGPAALQMVFNYYGENVSQSEIACVARSIGDPFYVTYTDELRRAGHFSNMSTSMGGELPENITGYGLRSLGYAAFESHGMNLTEFEETLGRSGPLILVMWYSSAHVSTHYRVATGYNETHVFLHDPWDNVTWSGKYGGPNIPFNNTEFMDLWSYFDNWALLVTPWKANLSLPTYIKPGSQFQVNATITYPEPPPNTLLDYPASSCNASIVLPANLSLAEGENQKKTLDTGFVQAGTNATVSWMLVANSSVTGMVNMTAEGMVSGWVPPEYNYTAYDYDDCIGVSTSVSIQLLEDQTTPEIGVPARTPDVDVQPYQDVRISVNITDAGSGVQNATLHYTTDNGTTWENVTIAFNQTASVYEATIPGQQAGIWVRFKISSLDCLDNEAVLDGVEPYCMYQVVPELSSYHTLLLMLSTIAAAVVLRRKLLARQKF
jgi:hypothetical protein